MRPDFDELKNLYEKDPDAYESRRREIIQDYINNIGDKKRQDRAKQVQWVLEGELRKFKDPQARFNRMIELFWEQVARFVDCLK